MISIAGFGGGQGTNGMMTGGGLSMEAQRMLSELSPKLAPGHPIPTQLLSTVQVRMLSSAVADYTVNRHSDY